MKIIEDRRAPNPRRVRIFLFEKSVDVEYVHIDIMNLDHKTADFSALNARQRVPILILDDGSVIAETMAICRYMEAIRPDPSLFGVTAKDIARIEMWNRRIEFELLLPVAQVVRHGIPAMAPLENPQIADWAEANRPRVMAMLQFLDAELANREFIAGDEYSVADITALVAVDFMRAGRMRRPDDAVNLNRWYDAVSARPSAKA